MITVFLLDLEGRLVESSRQKRTKIFISYSHKDSLHLDRLNKHLSPMEREGLVDAWSDQKIQSGDKWREKIEQALAHAKIGVLLISADFLASSFITKVELPALLTVPL